MKKYISLLLILLLGIGIFLYPILSDCLNKINSSKAIIEYSENLLALDNEMIETIWNEAIFYNTQVYQFQKKENYKNLLKNYSNILNINSDGIIGFIDIDKINVHLPIYHGTSDSILQKGIGHLEWSSMPTGEKDEHIVLVGHTGLTSAKLFTDLDKLEVGDTFTLTILNKELLFTINNIEVVAPDDINSLYIADGQTLCTLVTCTPYGINTHRLLIHASLS